MTSTSIELSKNIGALSFTSKRVIFTAAVAICHNNVKIKKHILNKYVLEHAGAYPGGRKPGLGQ